MRAALSSEGGGHCLPSINCRHSAGGRGSQTPGTAGGGRTRGPPQAWLPLTWRTLGGCTGTGRPYPSASRTGGTTIGRASPAAAPGAARCEQRPCWLADTLSRDTLARSAPTPPMAKLHMMMGSLWSAFRTAAAHAIVCCLRPTQLL